MQQREAVNHRGPKHRPGWDRYGWVDTRATLFESPNGIFSNIALFMRNIPLPQTLKITPPRPSLLSNSISCSLPYISYIKLAPCSLFVPVHLPGSGRSSKSQIRKPTGRREAPASYTESGCSYVLTRNYSQNCTEGDTMSNGRFQFFYYMCHKPKG